MVTTVTRGQGSKQCHNTYPIARTIIITKTIIIIIIIIIIRIIIITTKTGGYGAGIRAVL